MTTMSAWEEKRVLIVGKTYPSYSESHDELTCTGGLLERSLELVRLHPVPYRLFDDSRRFRDFQWVSVKLRPHDKDSRPGSYRIDPESIKLEEQIDPKDTDGRRRVLESCPQQFASVEALKHANGEKGTSLGIIRPFKITGCRVSRRSEDEIREWREKEVRVRSQSRLFGGRVMKIDAPEATFMVKWYCNDAECSSHEMAMHEWGLHELYRKYKEVPGGDEKVADEMKRRLNMDRYDLYFFLGNFKARRYNFGLMKVAFVVKERFGDKESQGGLLWG